MHIWRESFGGNPICGNVLTVTHYDGNFSAANGNAKYDGHCRNGTRYDGNFQTVNGNAKYGGNALTVGGNARIWR